MVMVLAYLHDLLQQTQTVNGWILHTKISHVDWSRSERKRDRLVCNEETTEMHEKRLASTVAHATVFIDNASLRSDVQPSPLPMQSS